IAAGVAAMALVLMRSGDPVTSAPALQMAAVPAAQAGDAGLAASAPAPVAAAVAVPAAATVDDTPPPSYTSPVESTPLRITGSLASYVVAHSEVAASAGRLLPLSAAMN